LPLSLDYPFCIALSIFSNLQFPSLKEKSRDLNRNSIRNKNETMFGSGYENCPEFVVLGGVIFKLDIL
jgi:hypothetical protein